MRDLLIAMGDSGRGASFSDLTDGTTYAKPGDRGIFTYSGRAAGELFPGVYLFLDQDANYQINDLDGGYLAHGNLNTAITSAKIAAGLGDSVTAIYNPALVFGGAVWFTSADGSGVTTISFDPSTYAVSGIAFAPSVDAMLYSSPRLATDGTDVYAIGINGAGTHIRIMKVVASTRATSYQDVAFPAGTNPWNGNAMTVSDTGQLVGWADSATGQFIIVNFVAATTSVIAAPANTMMAPLSTISFRGGAFTTLLTNAIGEYGFAKVTPGIGAVQIGVMHDSSVFSYLMQDGDMRFGTFLGASDFKAAAEITGGDIALVDSYGVLVLNPATGAVIRKVLDMTTNRRAIQAVLFCHSVPSYTIGGTVVENGLSVSREVVVFDQSTMRQIRAVQSVGGVYSSRMYTADSKVALAKSVDNTKNWQVRAYLTPVLEA